jgi:LmbE family N-acetylglucosaminyl deacetylase
MTRTTLVLTALWALGAGAQEPGMNAAELAHALDRLGGTARVLYVAAHPDDENTRLLAYLAQGRHVTAAYLSMTRGGGGQNLIGAEQGELLDVLRTEELLAARRLDGAVQRFSRMRDFGYSKSAEETFSVWGREEALADLVWVVRTFQPDVIVTRFNEQPPNHGHHTASALLAREAFTAAAGPARFPEQLVRGVKPWQATRLVHNFPTWRGDRPPADALALDVGGYDPRLGMGFAELAALSRSQHKSQGFGVAGERGEILEHFVHLDGARAKADLLEGIVTDWSRYGEAAAPFARAVAEARRVLHRDRPEQALPALWAAHQALDALPAHEPRIQAAREQLAALLLGASGLFLRATAKAPAAVPGDEIPLSVEVVARRPSAWRLERLVLPGGGKVGVDVPLVPGRKQVVQAAFVLPEDAPISVPYWLEKEAAPGHYRVADPSLIGEPKDPPPLAVEVVLGWSGRTLSVRVPLVFAWTDPVHGERLRPVLVQPPASLTPHRDAVLSTNGKPAPLVLRVRAARDGVQGEVTLVLPPGWRSAPASQPVSLARTGDEAQVQFALTHRKDAQAGVVRPVLKVGERAWSFREDTVDHPHVPLQAVLQPAQVRAVPLQIRLPKGRVGYVRGSGDSVAEDLAHIGVRVEHLDDDALRAGNFSGLAAIVLGVRAYNTRAALRAAHPRLMDWVEGGGTLVVQYNTHNRLAPLESPVGPWPLELGRDRVTDEHAKVEPVDPRHPALRVPNVLTEADFEGWVQERGIYFASKWDPRYQPLFRMGDPGEPALEGSTLYAPHGKGRFVYTGLSFFRQLPAGVPGGYRLLVNLLGAR